jgi:hypothetical protein
MGASGYVHLDVEHIRNETDNAFLLTLSKAHGGIEIWMPKSQVADSEDYKKGDKNCTVSVTEWVYKAKGLGTKK